MMTIMDMEDMIMEDIKEEDITEDPEGAVEEVVAENLNLICVDLMTGSMRWKNQAAPLINSVNSFIVESKFE